LWAWSGCRGISGRQIQLVQDRQNAIAALDGSVEDEAEAWEVFEDDGTGDEVLEADSFASEDSEGFALLRSIADDTDEDSGGFEVVGKADIRDGDESGLGGGDFAMKNLPDLALEQLAYAMMTER
jgi:hypothetical protein